MFPLSVPYIPHGDSSGNLEAILAKKREGRLGIRLKKLKCINLSPIATTMHVPVTSSLISGQASPFYRFIFCAMFALTLSLVACTKFCHHETTIVSGNNLPTGYNSPSNKIWVHQNQQNLGRKKNKKMKMKRKRGNSGPRGTTRLLEFSCYPNRLLPCPRAKSREAAAVYARKIRMFVLVLLEAFPTRFRRQTPHWKSQGGDIWRWLSAEK
ncbi:hypothetical protein Golob_008299 [Gossypium lobatum]|uniref:Uncharacterized protein n=1 Tax=Gossypium lobatum TaxID=34289 RepID=A0A7J8MF85_9ROSI|nr:hypothetical protein [Gossypium lobatum]